MATDEVLHLESLPLGFRFRPTDEELLNHYLKRKINGKIKADSAVIREVDVCKYEPWDLPEKSIIKSGDLEWFFFSPKDRKYPNGRSSKRATDAGYWKSTGIDRSIRTGPPSPMEIGKKKTLVFYRGRARKAERTGWIIHEYRTVEPEFDQGGFVICRLFKKPEESIVISNGDKINCNILTPDIPQSSPDTVVQGDDALYEITPPHQEIVPPNWPETVDESTKKSEETHSNSDISADIDAIAICMDNLKDGPDPSNLSSLNFGCGQSDSDLFCDNSPSDMSYPQFDDNVEISELLASFLDFGEECLPEYNEFQENATESLPSPLKDDPDPSYLSSLNLGCGQNDSDLFYYKSPSNMSCLQFDDNVVGASLIDKDVDFNKLLALLDSDEESNKFLENTTESLPSTQVCPVKPETFLDNTSAIDSIIGDNADVEVLLLLDAPALASYYQMSAPISPSSYLIPRAPNSYQFDALLKSVEFNYPQNSTANELQSMNSFNGNIMFGGSDALETLFTFADHSQDQFKNEPNPSGADNSTGSGIKLLPPKKQTSSHCKAHRRIRLQTSLRIGSTVITNRNSTSSNKLHDEKAEISESGNNAEVQIPKMAYLGPSDNDVLSSSNNSQTKELNELCVEPESTLKKAPKAASINFGRVTVVLQVILCVLCIGIGWFFSCR